MANGYLRQGEFRRWAEGVDRRLDQVGQKVDDHASKLAVLTDRLHQTDDDRRERRKFLYGLIASGIVSLLTLLGGLYHILTAAH